MSALGGWRHRNPDGRYDQRQGHPDGKPESAAQDAEQCIFNHDHAKDIPAAVAKRHHRAKFSRSLENAHVHAVRHTEQNHDKNDKLQHTELAFVQLYRFFVEIVQLVPGFDFQSGSSKLLLQ